MTDLTRRLVLGSALAAPAFAQSAWAAGLYEPLADAPVLPREHLLFDFGWKFAFGHGADPAKDFGFGADQNAFAKTGDFKFSRVGFDDKAWRMLDLPHDWAIELPFVRDDDAKGVSKLAGHGYKPLGRSYPETSVGWYRREFDLPASDKGRRVWVEFDGAFRDVFVFVNGCFIGRNNNGYAPFRFDLTDFLNYGGKNAIVMRVDASFGDGWFYEGAGVYRHVWLTKTDRVHLARWESTVRTSVSGADAALALDTIVENQTDKAANVSVSWRILGPGGEAVGAAKSAVISVPAHGAAPVSASAQIAGARLWSVETPQLYSAVVTVETDGAVRDGEKISFGVRTLRFDADRGFFLNGKAVKIKGVCNHQDHAGVGAALPDALQAFRLTVMQEMGCNAVRTSHNIPTPELVAACDQLGVLMCCEARLMSSNVEGIAQLDAMVKRYRNAPSIFLWSIGNEEWTMQDKMPALGEQIAATMVRRCHELDPTRLVTIAVNGGNNQGVSNPVDVIGFNYNLDPEHDFAGNKLDVFRKNNPGRPIIGTETASSISTRGEYSTDKARNTVSSYDGRVEWGETAEQWWKFYAAREWLAGGFAWTGFDYRGEPTPYQWPSISSQFGIVDMCGFPKDFFHYYKAWWRDEPALHVFPHWNWAGKEGQPIDVWVYSNLDAVELFVNGKSAGRQEMPRLGHLSWKVPYQPGAIEARGYKNGKLVLTQKRETAGPATRLRVSADRVAIDADGEDTAVLKFEALDAQGRAVPHAGDMIAFTVSGEGRLIGVGNGDPNCQEADKAPRRSLFNGLAQVLVQSTKKDGSIRIIAAPEKAGSLIKPAAFVVRTRRATLRPSVA